MARSRAFKTYLPDEFPDKAVGIKLPLNRDSYEKLQTANYIVPIVKNVGIFVQSYSTEDQAISNMINLLLTRPGERVMQPELGSPIPDYQFEQNSRQNIQKLETGVREAIKRWLPYIDVGGVKVRFGQDNEFDASAIENAVSISIDFKVTQAGANRTITLAFNERTEPIVNVI